MHWIRTYGLRTVAIAMLLVMVSVIAKTLLDGPLFTPNRRDVALAQDRVAVPAAHTGAEQNAGQAGQAAQAGAWVAGLGLIEPREQESRLAPGVPGRIQAIHVHEGDRVTAGTLLVSLESGAEEATLAAAEADLAAASAGLLRQRRGLRPEEIQALLGDAQAAQTRARLSADAVGRLENAARSGAVTIDELDRARRQAESDQLVAGSAQSRQQAAGSGRREDVMVASAQVRAARSRVEQARAALARLRIVAPIDGTIMEIHYRVGEYVQPGGAGGQVASEPVVVMGDLSVLRARVDIDERDIAAVHVGARAKVTLDAFPGREFTGRVVSVGLRMGRKNVRTDEPTERIDTKVLETVVELEHAEGLLPGLRIMGWVATAH